MHLIKINRIIKVHIGILLVLILNGCQSNFNTSQEFEKNVENVNSSFSEKIEKNGVRISLTFLPTETLMISNCEQYNSDKKVLLEDSTLLEDQKKEKLVQMKEILNKNRELFDKSLYFKLNIGYIEESKDLVYNTLGSGFNNYSQWVQKLLYSLRQNIFLEIDEKKIPLSLYHMENNYGLTKERTFLLLFPRMFDGCDLTTDWNNLKLKIEEFGLGTDDVFFSCNDLINKNQICSQLSRNL